jgi:hypothetical protein
VFEAGLDRFCKAGEGRGVSWIFDALQWSIEAAGGPSAQAGGPGVVERGIGRDGYRVCADLSGEADWSRDERIAGAVPEEEYRAGVCAACSLRAWMTEVAVEIRGQSGEGAGGADAVLQTAEEGLAARRRLSTGRESNVVQWRQPVLLESSPLQSRIERKLSNGLSSKLQIHASEHEWIDGRCGKTGHDRASPTMRRSSLGDIVFVELPKVGDKVEKGKVFGSGREREGGLAICTRRRRGR